MTWTLEDVCYRVLPRVRAGRALADPEWLTLAKVADTLLDGCPVSIRAEQAADNVERFLVAGRSRRAWRVRVLLTLLEYVTVVPYGAPFSRLDPRTRRRVVEERLMEDGHVWALCAKVRLLVLMGIYGDDRAHPATSFVPVLARVRHRDAPRTAPPENGHARRALESGLIVSQHR